MVQRPKDPEHSCSQCLHFACFPSYVKPISPDGFCRRPEVLNVRGRQEMKDKPLFVNDARHETCRFFVNAEKYLESLGIDDEFDHTAS